MRAAGFGLERLIEREQGGRRWLGMARPVIVLTTMAPISLGSTLAAPHRAFCHFLERVECVAQEHLRPLFPAMLTLVPFGRIRTCSACELAVAPHGPQFFVWTSENRAIGALPPALGPCAFSFSVVGNRAR
jgi:hypothetical protein